MIKLTGIHPFIFSSLLLCGALAPSILHAEETAELSTDEKKQEATEENHADVIIVGEPTEFKRIAGSAHFLDSDKLELLEYDDIHRVLAQIPGVYVREEDGFGLRPNIGLRGASSDRSAKLTLMEDGILLGPAPYSAPAAYYFPLMTRISGTEIFKGPASIRYGPGTIGGALNLITRPIPNGSLAALDVAGGEFTTGKAHGIVGFGGKHLGFVLEGVHLRTDGFKKLDTGGPTGFAKNEAMFKGHYRIETNAGSFHELELKLGYSTELSNETYMGLSEEDFKNTPYRRYAASQNGLMDWTRTQATLSHLWSLSDALEIHTTAYRHDFQRAWTKVNRFETTYGSDLRKLLKTDLSSGIPQGLYQILSGATDSSSIDGANLVLGTNDRAFFSHGIQSALRWRSQLGSIEQDIEFGLRFHQDQIERNHTTRMWAMTDGQLEDTQTGTLPTNNIGKASALALYIRDEIRTGDFFFTPGIRLESIATQFISNDSTTGEKTSVDATQHAFIPGLGAYYKLTENFGILAGVYRGFSPVAPGSSVSNAADKQDVDPEPELSVNYEAGFRLNTGDSELEVIGFFNDYENITASCRLSASGQCGQQYGQQFNGGRAWVYGGELALKHTQPLFDSVSATVQSAYTLSLSEFRDSFKSSFDQYGEVSAGDRLPYVPRHQGHVSLGFFGKISKTQRWHLETGVHYVGQMRDVAGQGAIEITEKIPAHTVLDLVATYSFGHQNSLYLKVDNLLNEAYMVSRRPYGPRPGKPRLVMIGYKHQFTDFL